jgi:hypothetical protein
MPNCHRDVSYKYLPHQAFLLGMTFANAMAA